MAPRGERVEIDTSGSRDAGGRGAGGTKPEVDNRDEPADPAPKVTGR